MNRAIAGRFVDVLALDDMEVAQMSQLRAEDLQIL